MIRRMVFFLMTGLIFFNISFVFNKFDDLKGFFVIIGTFVLAFGIALQAILYPGDKFTPKIFIEIFNMAYWPIYGEMGILEIIKKDKCEDGEICLDSATQASSFMLLMIYMVIANVLLINLLIAMFRFLKFLINLNHQ
jgi:hypothetical protein